MSLVRATQERYLLPTCRKSIDMVFGKREDGLIQHRSKLAAAHERSPPL